MAQTYLDFAGLQHYDQKLKASLANPTHSYTVAQNAAKNWYRLANATGSQTDTSKPLHVQFLVTAWNSGADTGYYLQWFVDCQVFGRNAGIRIFGNSGAPFSQIRVLYENTIADIDANDRPAIDLYLNYVLANAATNVKVEEIYNSGWTFVADGALAASTVPTGFENVASAPSNSGIGRAANSTYADYAALQRSDITANATLADSTTYRGRLLNCTNAITLTLPSINSVWSWFIIKNFNAIGSGKNVTIHPSTTSVLIDGSNADIVLAPGEYVLLHSRAANSYTRLMDGRAYQGATASVAGREGLVPAPAIADKDKFLKGDGTWAQVAWSNVTSKPSSFTPTAHASSATTYGVSSASNYGHAKASSTTPKAPASTASVGSETSSFARGDHVHPMQKAVTEVSGSVVQSEEHHEVLNPSFSSSIYPLLGGTITYSSDSYGGNYSVEDLNGNSNGDGFKPSVSPNDFITSGMIYWSNSFDVMETSTTYGYGDEEFVGVSDLSFDSSTFNLQFNDISNKPIAFFSDNIDYGAVITEIYLLNRVDVDTVPRVGETILISNIPLCMNSDYGEVYEYHGIEDQFYSEFGSIDFFIKRESDTVFRTGFRWNNPNDSSGGTTLRITATNSDGTTISSDIYASQLISDYQGATSSASGVAGLVPAATSAQQENFLKGDGTWATVSTEKDVAVITSEPTAANTTTLANESIIFYNTGSAQNAPQPVFTSGNQTIGGVKTFSAGIFSGKQTMSGTAMDCAAASCFTKTVTANTTFSFTNVPSDAVCCVTLVLINGGNYTVNWPSSVKWTGNLPPALTENGTDVLTFITCTGGNVWYGTATCIGVTA